MGRSSSCTCQKRHAEEANVAKQLFCYFVEFLQDDLAHTVYICCCFRFDASPKKLFVSSNYHVLFVCQTPMVCKVNNKNIQ